MPSLGALLLLAVGVCAAVLCAAPPAAAAGSTPRLQGFSLADVKLAEGSEFAAGFELNNQCEWRPRSRHQTAPQCLFTAPS